MLPGGPALTGLLDSLPIAQPAPRKAALPLFLSPPGVHLASGTRLPAADSKPARKRAKAAPTLAKQLQPRSSERAAKGAAQPPPAPASEPPGQFSDALLAGLRPRRGAKALAAAAAALDALQLAPVRRKARSEAPRVLEGGGVAGRVRRCVKQPQRFGAQQPAADHNMVALERYTQAPGSALPDAQPFRISVRLGRAPGWDCGAGRRGVEERDWSGEWHGQRAEAAPAQVHPVALVAMDAHAHLCQHEVIGVLGGRFDAAAGTIDIVQARCVKELEAGGDAHINVEMDPVDQQRVVRRQGRAWLTLPRMRSGVLVDLRRDRPLHLQVQELDGAGLQCVGWYHSHPTFAALPSGIDVLNQVTHQMHHRGDDSAPAPYVAAIVGPYHQKLRGLQSALTWFYVEREGEGGVRDCGDSDALLATCLPKRLTVDTMAGPEAAVTSVEVCALVQPLLATYAGHTARTDIAAVSGADLGLGRLCLRARAAGNLAHPFPSPLSRGASRRRTSRSWWRRSVTGAATT